MCPEYLDRLNDYCLLSGIVVGCLNLLHGASCTFSFDLAKPRTALGSSAAQVRV